MSETFILLSVLIHSSFLDSDSVFDHFDTTYTDALITLFFFFFFLSLSLFVKYNFV